MTNVKSDGRFKRTCSYCGEVFRTASPKTRYCSPAHKQKAYRERKERQKATQ